jgi:hypothetical protein
MSGGFVVLLKAIISYMDACVTGNFAYLCKHDGCHMFKFQFLLMGLHPQFGCKLIW